MKLRRPGELTLYDAPSLEAWLGWPNPFFEGMFIGAVEKTDGWHLSFSLTIDDDEDGDEDVEAQRLVLRAPLDTGIRTLAHEPERNSLSDDGDP